MEKGYAICLIEWLEDEQIKTELRLLLKISSLTAADGVCWASNSYFSKYFNTTEVTISKQIKKLEKLGYLSIKYYKRGAEVLRREIRLKKTLTDEQRKLKPTIKENFKENIITKEYTTTKERTQFFKNTEPLLKNPLRDEQQESAYMQLSAEDKLKQLQEHVKNNAELYYKQVPGLKQQIKLSSLIERYNAQLITEGTEHSSWSELLKHWRNWLLKYNQLHT